MENFQQPGIKLYRKKYTPRPTARIVRKKPSIMPNMLLYLVPDAFIPCDKNTSVL